MPIFLKMKFSILRIIKALQKQKELIECVDGWKEDGRSTA